MRGWLRVVPVVVVCLIAALAVGCGSSGDSSSDADTQAAATTETPAKSAATTADEPAQAPAMTGPNGEPAVGADAVALSPADIRRIRDGDFTVAFAWHTTDTFTKAVEIAARRRLQELGIRVVAATVADFDPAKQESDLKTIQALEPDVIVTLPVDPASSAKMYREARRAGAQLVFVSNTPAGFRHGEDYVGVVTTDVVGAARESARLLGDELGGEGKVGVLFYDAEFFIVNQWDEAFEAALKEQYPDIEIAARAGFADPARANEPASAMLARNPDLDGIYVSWQDPAVGVLTALRAAGRNDVAVTDVGMNETTALDMVRDGAFIGAGVDGPVAMGTALADEVGYAVLGRDAPAFLVSGYDTITKDDVLDKWPQVYGVPAPAPVVEAAGG